MTKRAAVERFEPRTCNYGMIEPSAPAVSAIKLGMVSFFEATLVANRADPTRSPQVIADPEEFAPERKRGVVVASVSHS
jgi:hypothetical protein